MKEENRKGTAGRYKLRDMAKHAGVVLSIILIGAFALMAFGCQSNESVPETEPSATGSGTASSASGTTATDSNSSDWKQFLDDYEAWADDYVTFVDKYVQNPSDPSLVSEYASMSSKVLELEQQSKTVEKSLQGEDLTNYTEQLKRIVDKVTPASEKLATAALEQVS